MTAYEPELAHLSPDLAPFFTGYRIELEPRDEMRPSLRAASEIWCKSYGLYDWRPPAQLDPRAWFDIHDQGRVGSCQGNSLADAVEFAHLIATGEEVQLSRSFSYMSSQEKDGLLGSDSGSTLSGGTWAAARGVPDESLFPYQSSYREMLSAYRDSRDKVLAGPLYQCAQAVGIYSSDEAVAFLGSFSGAIQIGLDWNVALTDGWEIKKYQPARRGGHAVLICGYVPVASWKEKYGLLLKNSWSKTWGRDGWALVKPSAFDQMINARYTTAIGRSDCTAPRPSTERIEHAQSAGIIP